ncbi:MAG: CDP-glycerol glycerophosphotransferase family protein [Nitrososphaerales archaeon]
MLLVVDVPSWDNYRLAKILKANLTNLQPNDAPLDVMAFVDIGLRELEDQIRVLWKGPLNFLCASKYLDKVGLTVRRYACCFTADLRERLEGIAAEVGGNAWAKRFGELWWYTETSEKNSPATPPWWDLLRLEAIRARLKESKYRECIYLGAEEIIDPLRHVCDCLAVGMTATGVRHYRASLTRLLVLRTVSFFFLVFANVLARLTPCQNLEGEDLNEEEGKYTFAFTYFPRSWTEDKRWTDRYYGRLFDGEPTGESKPVFILGLLDHLNPTTFRMAWERYRLLRRDGLASRRYLVLESYTSISEILWHHVSPRDILQYLKMRRTSGFRDAFQWHGVDVSNLVEARVLRSVVFDWPHLEVLERCTERVSKVCSPAVSWLYFFEYGPGRALIRGLKAGGGGKVLGLQHGPITPMKFIYASDARDRRRSPTGGPPVPEPDFYIVEGSRARRILEESGIASDRIVISKAPRMEKVSEGAQRRRDRELFSRDPVQVLVALGLHDFEFALEFVCEALADNPAVHITVKPHPKTRVEKLHWLKQSRGDEITLVAHTEDIYTLMEGADILIGTYSSAVVEAVAFGIPVILLKSNRVPDMSPFFSYDSIVLTANDGNTLRTHVEGLMRDSIFREAYLHRLQDILPEIFEQADDREVERIAALGHNPSGAR